MCSNTSFHPNVLNSPAASSDRSPAGGSETAGRRSFGSSSHGASDPAPAARVPASNARRVLAGEQAAGPRSRSRDALPDPHFQPTLDKSGKARQPTEEEREGAREAVAKRRRSKYLTMDLVRELAGLDSPLHDQYMRALGCCNHIEQIDGEVTTKYCRCRWCVVCNRIRMAKRIDRYMPVFEEWGDVQFVTLTVPNVRAGGLSETLDEMRHQLKLCRKQIRRTRGLEYRSVRAIEVTFNADRGDFHPHFHIAVYGEVQARALVIEWLKRWPDAVREAQHIEEWDGEAGSLKELTKYCTKLVAGEKEEKPPVWALDAIFQALEGRHLFRPCGFELPNEVEDWEDVEDLEDLKATLPAWKRVDESVLWEWSTDFGTWIDRRTGEMLVEGPDPPAG